MTADDSPAQIIADAIENIGVGHAQLAVDALEKAGYVIVRKPPPENENA